MTSYNGSHGPMSGPPRPNNGHADQPPHSRTFIFFNVLNTITHFALGLVSMVPVIFAVTGTFSASFRQHVVLCVLGYQLLMAQAIMTFNTSNGWAVGLKYQEKKVVHWVLQVAGSALAIAGSAIRIQALGNFSTPHGILGLTALILTIISFLGGIVNLYSLRLRIPPNFIKVAHAFFGSAAFIIAGATLCYGFDKSSFRGVYMDLGANIMIGFTVVAIVGTLLGAFESMFNRLFTK